MKSRICFAKKNLADWIQLVWLAASCPIIITCGAADINPCSAQQRRPLFFFALFFWATGQRLRQLYLIGSYGEDRENTQHSDWIPGVCGSHSWRQLWGERGVTEKEAWLWWCWWSFYQSLCYRCTCSPRNYVSLAKVWEVHKANLTMVFLHFSLGLNSIVVCLSLQLLIMMSILSYLLGSAWLLISSQHSSATLLVPAPTTQQKLSLFFLSSSFFSFLDNDLLPVVCCYTSCWVSPNKNLTRASEVVSTIHFWQQTANPSLLFNKWKVFL